ncbi:hypothetical protein FJZ19_00385 [Candidatus Pacearchaeota archaeon]|nr:hypothetical protein [Candidatus Pacearchaeota archaeon]
MEKINAIIMLEVMGRPANYVKKSLSEIVGKIGKEKGIKITKKKINSPRKIENSLFLSFAEIEIEAENIASLARIIFLYMPSHIDIIKPQELGISNYDLNSVFNEIIRKLHEYDAVAKAMIFEKNIILNQLEEKGIKINLPENKEEKK